MRRLFWVTLYGACLTAIALFTTAYVASSILNKKVNHAYKQGKAQQIAAQCREAFSRLDRQALSDQAHCEGYPKSGHD